MSAPPNDWSIREAVPADLDAFVEHLLCYEAGWDAASGELPYGPYDTGDDTTPEQRRTRVRERWARSMDEPSWGRTMLAEVGGAIVGHVDLHGDFLKTGLHRTRLGVGVEAPHRGAGVGRALVEAAIDWCRAQPRLAWLELGVFVGNDRARGLYERLGFRSTGVVPDRFRVDGRSIDDEWMVLDVST